MKRKQYVEFTSDLSPITTGVPQGSILGPLLFLIYKNDIRVASALFTLIVFADDTTLLFSIKKEDNIVPTPEGRVNFAQ